MTKLVIKKRIALDFLGDEYKDSYVIVKSIGVGEYENLKGTVRDQVVERFIEGKIEQDGQLVDITPENILDLTGDAFVEIFNAMTGILPKVENN